MEIKNAACYSLSLSSQEVMAYLRIIGPFQQAGINILNGIEHGKVMSQRVTDGDVVVIQREFPKLINEYKKVIDVAQREEKPLIFDLDDLLFYLPGDHPDRGSQYYPSSLLPMFQALLEADLVSVSTQMLQNEVTKYNDNVVVIPNYFDDSLWQFRPPTLKTNDDIITIGYMGGNSHKPDIEYLSPVLLDLIKQFPKKLHFHFWGVEPSSEMLSSPQVEWTPYHYYTYKDFTAYFQTQSADIFIAPLVANLFNRCKSPLKFFEYSALGAVGVYSRLEPYTGVVSHRKNGLLAYSLDEWRECLIELIEDGELRSRLATNAQDTIHENWLMSQNAFRWRDAYQDLTRKTSSQIHIPEILQSINEQLQETEKEKTAETESQTEEIQSMQLQLTDFDEQIQVLQTHLTDRDAQIHTLQLQVTDRDEQLHVLDLQLSDLDEQLQGLFAQMAEREEQLKGLHGQIDVREERIQTLYSQLATRDDQIQLLQTQLVERDGQVQKINMRVADLDAQNRSISTQLHEINISKAWRVAMLIRNIRVWLVPPGSWRAVFVRKIRFIVLYPFRMRKEIQITRDLGLIRGSGLFDAKWYLGNNPDVTRAAINPLRHFLLHGGFEGRDPGPDFSTRKYMDNQDLEQLGMNPLIHYLRNSKSQDGLNREKQFKTKEIKSKRPNTIKYNLSLAILIWRTQGFKKVLKRIGERLKLIQTRERRDIKIPPPFSQNDDGSRDKKVQVFEASRNEEGSEYVYISKEDLSKDDHPVKLIAFYLPQFHPIPENDLWWGKGFTEWTNVTKAVPQFVGHYQPRLPGELGFYDLRLPEIQHRQVDLAKQYGIFGFCFHYYWFNGNRLLERPLDQFVADPNINFPFCLCWANENWTRRWDGYDQEILIEQTISQDTDYRFIQNIAPYLKHRNYIRIEGRPVLIIYRSDILKNPVETVANWREFAIKEGIGNPYIIVAQVFGHRNFDPTTIGFDAAVEFPPNTMPIDDINDNFRFLSPDFSGKVFDYRELAELMGKRKTKYPLFKTVMPSWDNTARRPNKASIFTGSPSSYEQWLRLTLNHTLETLPEANRFVFINAWNEWAEAAYLEPDQKYGYAYLQATATALKSLHPDITSKPKLLVNFLILFVSHDANRGGAQLDLLNAIRWLAAHTSIRLKLLCLEGGEWLPEFKQVAETMVLSSESVVDEERLAKIREFCGGNPDLIYANTVVSAKVYHWLSQLGVPILTHIHELQSSIERYAGEWINDLLKYTDKYIACSLPVQKNLMNRYDVAENDCRIVYEFIQPDTRRPLDGNQKRIQREQLGLKVNEFLVMGCGIGMPFRKGADLFVEIARLLLDRIKDGWHFYWIGDFDLMENDPKYGTWAEKIGRMQEEGLDERVTFLGLQDDVRAYLRAGDVFLMTSREDPFPLVMMEAAESGLPVIGFADSGGVVEFVRTDAGFIVPFEDCDAFAEKIAELMENNTLRKDLGLRGRKRVLEELSPDAVAPQILSYVREIAGKTPAVSVIVPNYNHARYLPNRLESIFNQSYRDFEVIFLDDNSTDESLKVFEKYANRVDVRIEVNQQNSGSTFPQWLKGIELARAPIIWIAESDDWCELDFLENLLPAFNDPDVKLAYCASAVVDEDDNLVGEYRTMDYLTSLSSTRWWRSYSVSAEEEINAGLGIKNVVLNMSAALFRKFEVSSEAAETLIDMRISGDWFFILNALSEGKVSYESKRINFHRRHEKSVIGRLLTEKRQEDIHRFYHEFAINTYFVVENYPLSRDFLTMWIAYQDELWRELAPGRPREELNQYFPFEELKKIIEQNI